MRVLLAEEFFCSDKLTMSVSHIATVWHILWGAVVGTQMLHTIGVSQCDSSCFLFFGEGGVGGAVFLNLNFQVKEAGWNRN